MTNRTVDHENCVACKGTGEARWLLMAEPPPCPWCGGTGRQERRPRILGRIQVDEIEAEAIAADGRLPDSIAEKVEALRDPSIAVGTSDREGHHHERGVPDGTE